MLLRRLAITGLILAGVLPCQVMAENAQISGNITVTASIASSCQVTTQSSSAPLSGDFGTIAFDASDWTSGKAIDAQGLALVVTCTAGNTPVVKLNGGGSYNQDTKTWNMVNKTTTGAKLPYQFYSDSTHTTVITPGTDINVQKANPFNVTIAGEIPVIQNASSITAGDYSDTVQMTVDWGGS